jgi:filamentous hemagglutinin family protein
MRTRFPLTSKQLLSASGLALGTALVAAAPAIRAQSFQGTPVSTFGNVSIFATLSATDVTVSSPSAVINWVPTDTAATGGPIIFQPTGTTATFRNNPDLTSDFTVLNRIIPSGSNRPIQFNGNVVSRLQSAAGQVAGGTVFFYSPGGILIGSSGVFDVGNLVLTTSDLAYNTADGSFGSAGQYVFQPATVTGSQILVSAGAQLGATTDGSYIAMVAPSVTNNGTINVNGSAALVAADAATIRFAPSGLFDIEVDSGTSATGTVAANNGTITGPAASNGAFFHRIYMVAVPKNDAITMAIGAGSTLGFDIAGAADALGNTIILSAGRSVGGPVVTSGNIQVDPPAGGGTGTVSIDSGGANYTSRLRAASTGAATFAATAGANLSFAHDVTITTFGALGSITATDGASATIGRDLRIDADGEAFLPGATPVGGEALLQAQNGGTINIGRDTRLTAEADGGAILSAGGQAGLSAIAGTARVLAVDGGQVTFGGNLSLEVQANGGVPATAGPIAGSATGGLGRVAVSGTSGSTITVAGTLMIAADADGGFGPASGGNATGGTAAVEAVGSGNSISVSGIANLFANGLGGDSNAGSGGTALGGLARVSSTGGGQIALTTAFLNGGAVGGDGTTGGAAGRGGSAGIFATDTGSSVTADSVIVTSFGYGGDAFDSGTGGLGQGGSTLVQAQSGGSISVTGALSLHAQAAAGDSYINNPDAIAGTINVLAAGSSSVSFFSTVNADATARGSAALAANNAGSTQGGAIVFAAQGGGNLTLGADLTALTTARGSYSLGGGTGGEAIGGAVQISSGVNSSVSVAGSVELEASGLGGDGLGTLNGGRAEGGDISIRAFGPGTGSGITFGSAVGLFSNPAGGNSAATGGTGGEAVAGTLALLADGANITIAGPLTAQAFPIAGDGFAGGGDAFGGNLLIEARNSGHISATSKIELDTTSFGGGTVGGGVGVGGAANGGNITLTANNGVIETLDSLLASNFTFAGDGPLAGGDATGAFLTFSTSGSGAITAATTLTLDARARAGSGNAGTGGTGQGGTVRLFMGGGQISSTDLIIDASGEGGFGSIGGDGLGGALLSNIGSATITATGTSTINALGTGGAGSGSNSAGQGTGGSLNLSATTSSISLGGVDGATLNASGVAGTGGAATGQGGSIVISSTASTIGTNGALRLYADGQGSVSRSGASGGDGLAGSISLATLGDSRGLSTISSPTLILRAKGMGGDGSFSGTAGVDSGAGGSAKGGTISLATAVDGGVISAADFVADATALSGSGGSGHRDPSTGLGKGGAGGLATGGTINVNTIAASSGTGAGGYDFGTALADASARGGFGGAGDDGFVPGQAGNGGNALGGSIQMQFDQGGSKIAVSDGLTVFADATGGDSGICGPGCAGAGGLATGGTIGFGSAGLTSGNTISLGALTLSAQAAGGGSYTSAGGAATGGGVFFRIGSGTNFTSSAVELVAEARGGDQYAGGTAGAATGGNASFIASGTSVATIDGPANLHSSGTGGAGRDVGAVGGGGTGGVARLYSDGGSITINGGANVAASGFGGAGYLEGGSGRGGAGTGGQALLTVGTPTAIGNNGRITVGGFSFVTAEGTGGDSFEGGTGTGGFVGISARQGTLLLDQTFATADGFGGYGQFGGAGGGAIGGGIEVVANSAIEGASQFTINNLVADATAFGGFGGDAQTAGQTGGAGGFADGGSILIAGSAGNGRLQIASVNASAGGVGGGGGAGTFGGAGGGASGGAVQIGTISGLDTGSVNTGSANYGAIFANAVGTAGNGGDGDATVGSGGAGGDATGGGTILLVRGSPVSISGAATFVAHALGGTGGAGATLGIGGNAVVGSNLSTTQIAGTALVITNRFQQAAQRGSLTVGGDLTFSAFASGGAGSVAGTSRLSGDVVDIEVVNSTLSATNLALFAEADTVEPQSLPSFLSLTGSSANLSGSLLIGTPGDFSLNLDQSSFTASAVSISAGNWVLPSTTPPATFGTLTGTGALSLSSGRDLVGYANLSTQGPLSLQALGRIEFGSLFSLGAMDLTAGGTVTLRDAQSGSSIEILAQGAVVTANLTATNSISIEANGNVTTANLAAGTGTPSGSNGDLYSISINANGNVTTGSIFAASDLGIAATGNIATGNARAFDTLLLAGGNVAVDSMNTVNRSLIANVTMAALGQTATGFDKELVFAAVPRSTAGSVSLANVSNVGSLNIAAGTTVTTGNVFAGGRIGVMGTGNLAFGTLSSQSDRIELFSRAGTISAATLGSSSDILVSGASGLSLGTVRGRDVALISRGDISVQVALAGAIFDPQTNQLVNAVGRLLIGNSSMLPVTAIPGSVNYNALFSAVPVRSGGNATIGNAGIAGRIAVATAGNFTGGGLAGFGAINVESGGLVTVSRRWGGPDVRIVSADLAIIDNGAVNGPTGQPIVSGIRTNETGSVQLISTSTAPALIGEGLSGAGYALSSAEIGLISTGQLLIAAVDQSANATDMLIGNLSLTAGGTIGSSNVVGQTGRITFASGNLQTEAPGGAIRVTGTINGTGFGQGNILEFTTGRFELDAATGAINLTSANQPGATTPLGGIVEINAANIHVAAGSILDKLAADPPYAGRTAELNAPAAVQRPQGVLRALGLDLFPTGTLYIQNTGTVLNPAGFFADLDFTDVTAPTGAAAGSLSVIVNGAFQTPTGVVSGIAAHDLVVNDSEANFTPFSADSQINGCAFTVTACTTVMKGADPIAAVSAQIAIIGTQSLGNTPAFVEQPAGTSSDPEGGDPAQEEQQQQEKATEGEEAASSPIAPPPQLIDSRPLEPASQIEQPVSGSGNPALIGSVVNENSAQGEDQ